jgi:hypothetical protein
MTVSFFALLAAWFSLARHMAPAWQLDGQTWVVVLLALAAGLALSGAVLVVLTLKLHESRLQKMFFLLTGASAVAMPICAILHNVVYGLFIWWFGEGFWGRNGDEPVFFILAIIVCPALFVVGSLGSMLLLIKKRMSNQGNTP